jgi:hypothetical protein
VALRVLDGDRIAGLKGIERRMLDVDLVAEHPQVSRAQTAILPAFEAKNRQNGIGHESNPWRKNRIVREAGAELRKDFYSRFHRSAGRTMNIHIRIAFTAAYVLMTFVQQFMDAHAPLGLQMAIMLASVLPCGILVDDDYSLFTARPGRLIRTPRI